MPDAKPVKVERDGVTMTVTSEAADYLSTSGWRPVKKSTRKSSSK